MQSDLQRLIMRHYRMPRHVAAFFAILILSEQVDTEATFTLLGVAAEARGLVYKLRRYLDGTKIEIRHHRGVGYWLDLDTRRNLANHYGIELGISIPGIANEDLHSGADAGFTEFQLPDVQQGGSVDPVTGARVFQPSGEGYPTPRRR